jgi:aryl-alcohol dehydrogenase-like predicted oxidoreductase
VTESTASVEPGPELVEADILVRSGNPDVEELAALTAVLSEALTELAAEQGRREAAVTSAWARSQRSVRATISPGPGAWRSFSG